MNGIVEVRKVCLGIIGEIVVSVEKYGSNIVDLAFCALDGSH